MIQKTKVFRNSRLSLFVKLPPKIMKRLPLLCLTCFWGTLVPVVLCGADVELSVTDGSGIDWFGYRSNTAKTVFTYENGKTTMTNLDSNSYVWGYLPNEITLNVGDTVTLTGTATFSSVASTGAFYFGLYNCGANTEPSPGTAFSSIVAGTYDMTGFFAGTNKKSTGTATQVFSRFSGKSPDASGKGGAGFMTSNQGGSYIASETPAQSLEHPTVGTDYAFSLKISRTAQGYDITVGNAEPVSFTNEKSLGNNVFNVIGMKSPGSGITLSNFSVSTTGIVPEPSAFAFSFCFFSMTAFVALRRNRKNKSIKGVSA